MNMAMPNGPCFRGYAVEPVPVSTVPASITIAGVRIPVQIEQETDGWWIARGRLSPDHPEYAAASATSGLIAADRLRKRLIEWGR